MKNLNLVNSSGQILAEVVVAIGVIVLVLIGMSSLMSKTTKTIRQNSTKDEAVRLVESQIKSYKQARDSDVKTFFDSMPSPVGSGPGTMDTFAVCDNSIPDSSWSIPTPSPTLTITPSCTVKFDNTNLGTDGITITVKATWTEETANDSSVSLSTTLMKF